MAEADGSPTGTTDGELHSAPPDDSAVGSRANPSTVPHTAEAREIAKTLRLEPHPEGGWFRRTWVGGNTVSTPNGPRPAATLIYYLLDAGEQSAWHVVDSDEIWLWHGPGELTLQLGGSGSGPDEAGPIRRLGLTPPAAEPQVLIPAGVWQRTLPVAASVLVEGLVSPGFTFGDWRLAK